MELLQAIGALVVALAGLVGVVTLSVRVSGRRTDELIAALRREAEAERQKTARLEQEVADLEAKREQDRVLLKANEQQISEMRTQIGTLLTELAALQNQVKKLETERDNERDEKERVRQERDALRETVRTLQKDIEHRDAQIAAYRDALALVRGETTDMHAVDASPEPGEGAGTPGHKED